MESIGDLLLDPNPELGPEPLLVRLLPQETCHLGREDLHLLAQLVEAL